MMWQMFAFISSLDHHLYRVYPSIRGGTVLVYLFLARSWLISDVCSSSSFSSLLVDREFSSSWISIRDVWFSTWWKPQCSTSTLERGGQPCGPSLPWPLQRWACASARLCATVGLFRSPAWRRFGCGRVVGCWSRPAWCSSEWLSPTVDTEEKQRVRLPAKATSMVQSLDFSTCSSFSTCVT